MGVAGHAQGIVGDIGLPQQEEQASSFSRYPTLPPYLFPRQDLLSAGIDPGRSAVGFPPRRVCRATSLASDLSAASADADSTLACPRQSIGLSERKEGPIGRRPLTRSFAARAGPPRGEIVSHTPPSDYALNF